MCSYLSGDQNFKEVTVKIIKSISPTVISEFSITVDLLHIPSGHIETVKMSTNSKVWELSDKLQSLISDTETINKVLTLMKSEEEKKMLFEALDIAENIGWREGYRDS